MAIVDQPPTYDEKTINRLFNFTMEKKWEKVEEIYRKFPETLSAKLTNSEDTGLHIAISCYTPRGNRQDKICRKELKEHVRKVISLCSEKDNSDCKDSKALKSQNVKGDTPLHLAAAIGWVTICDDIASRDPELVSIRNGNGETPLFIATHHGHLRAFLCLHCYYSKRQPADYSAARRKDGNTILHSAISREYFELAFQIINRFGKALINKKNVDGETPLHVLARMRNAFKSSSRHLNLYDRIIYKFAPVEELKERHYAPASSNNDHSGTQDQTFKCPENHQTCAKLFTFLWTSFYKCITAGFLGNKKRNGRPSDVENQHQKNEGEKGSNRDLYPRNYENTVLLFKFGMKIILVVLGFGYQRIENLRLKRKRHGHAAEIMNKLVDKEDQYNFDYTGHRPTEHKISMFAGDQFLHAPPSADELDAAIFSANGNPDQNQSEENKSDKQCKSTPILEAAKWGVLEVVDKILRKFPIAMHDVDTDGKNLLMVAAQYRQVSVFRKLLKHEMLQNFLFHQVDNEGNSILHLAARLEKGAEHWEIPGFGLQMQGEIKWYKYVKSTLNLNPNTPKMSFLKNKKGHTPKKIFVDTHGSLKIESVEWLRKTSESCSVIAALVASVGFATSASIPGGPNQNTGYPLFKDHPMFTVFAITSVIALSLSVTALVFFLSIIMSRFEVQKFKNELPSRLLMGLTFLFTSIPLMLASFCAGHSFILGGKVKVGAMPIYVLPTIPMMLFGLAQLPLYFDLLHSTQRELLRHSHKHDLPSRHDQGKNGGSGTGKPTSGPTPSR